MSDMYMDAHRFLTDEQIKDRDEKFKEMQIEWYENVYGEKWVYPKAPKPMDVEGAREVFENSELCKNLDLSKKKDSWGNVIYTHNHIHCMWNGYIAAIDDLNAKGLIGQPPPLSQKDARISELEGALSKIKRRMERMANKEDHKDRKRCFLLTIDECIEALKQGGA